MTKQQWKDEHRHQRVLNHLRQIEAEEKKPKDQVRHTTGLHWFMLYLNLKRQGIPLEQFEDF